MSIASLGSLINLNYRITIRRSPATRIKFVIMSAAILIL